MRHRFADGDAHASAIFPAVYFCAAAKAENQQGQLVAEMPVVPEHAARTRLIGEVRSEYTGKHVLRGRALL